MNQAFIKYKPPTVSFKSKDISTPKPLFYFDSGAEISLIKQDILEKHVKIDNNIIVSMWMSEWMEK